MILLVNNFHIHQASASLLKMAAAIKKQIEFYFGDANFRKDKFLRGVADKDADGCVPLATIMAFGRMKSLTTDPAEVVKALAGSTVCVVTETTIKRCNPLPSADDSQTRTVYAAGFPTAAEPSIEAVAEFFAQYGEVLLTRVRRDRTTKVADGTVFVEFKAAESVAKVIAAFASDAGVTFGDAKLSAVLPLTEFLAASRKASKGKKESSSKRKREPEAAKPAPFEAGLFLAVANIGEGVSFGDIKAALSAKAKPAFVAFEDGEDTATARFHDAAGAKATLDHVEAEGVEIGGKKVTLTVIAGEEEQTLWKEFAAFAAESAKRERGGGRGRGKGGRKGGRKGGKGGGRDRGSRNAEKPAAAAAAAPAAAAPAAPAAPAADAGEPAAKKAKTSE